MGTLKLRLKAGPFEFEAEGDPDTVQRERDSWLAHISSKVKTINTPSVQSSQAGKGTSDTDSSSSAEDISSVFKKDERGNISLTAMLPGEDRASDAALLLLLGHKEIKQEDEIYAVSLMASLKVSGYPLKRLDREMVVLKQTGSVLDAGMKRSKRYRITNSGINRAKELAAEVLQHL